MNIRKTIWQAGIPLIIIGVLILTLGYFLPMGNKNILNFSALAIIIIGVVMRVWEYKRSL